MIFVQSANGGKVGTRVKVGDFCIAEFSFPFFPVYFITC